MKIARPDHWIKQVFVIPGVLFAVSFIDISVGKVLATLLLGLIAVCLIASANYTINEWLDSEFDRFHPTKKLRPAVHNLVVGKYVYIQYAAIASIGLILSYFVSIPFLLTNVVLLVMGILYNVKPFRTKDIPFFDVLSESINNPIRLLLGWFIINPGIFPPSTLLLSYWMGGAFLMAVKRYSEYVFINNPQLAKLYRKSFEFYTKETLLTSAFFYAICSSFFLGVFMIKYRIELIVTFPFFSLLFAWYLAMSFKPDSPVQHPEKLYKERFFIFYCLFLALLTLVLVFVDIPILNTLTRKLF